VKSNADIEELLRLNSRIDKINNIIDINDSDSVSDSLMSGNELMNTVLDVHTTISNVDILRSALSVFDNQKIRVTFAAAMKLIDKLSDVELHCGDIIEQALRALAAACDERNYIDKQHFKKIFSALVKADTSSTFLAVLNFIKFSLLQDVDLSCVAQWSLSIIIGGFDEHGSNSEVLIAGCAFITECQDFYLPFTQDRHDNELFITKVMLSLLPHRAIDSLIVKTTACAIRKFSRSELLNEALMQMLITYGDDDQIFQAIAFYVARSNSDICNYFLHEIVKSYCYFGSAGLIYSSKDMRRIFRMATEIERRKLHEAIVQSVLWQANLGAVTLLLA
jgi:hypothetical protein